jgi:hypothetical protein
MVERLVDTYRKRWGWVLPDDLLRPQLESVVKEFRQAYSKPS